MFSAAIAFDGASSASRSARSSHAAPWCPMTAAMWRPETGCRACPDAAARHATTTVVVSPFTGAQAQDTSTLSPHQLATRDPTSERQWHSPNGTDLVGLSLTQGRGLLLAVAHHFDEPVASGTALYLARVYVGTIGGGRWGAWIAFFPIGGGPVISTDRETTQSSMAALSTWVGGLTHTYLEGALQRALELQ